ncbi:MAG: hypothetical protein FWE12_07535 [Oscillospiraceae bacterium]|nr:hypothetical protein [Oscillospiraceae bacterium]
MNTSKEKSEPFQEEDTVNIQNFENSKQEVEKKRYQTIEELKQRVDTLGSRDSNQEVERRKETKKALQKKAVFWSTIAGTTLGIILPLVAMLVPDVYARDLDSQELAVVVASVAVFLTAFSLVLAMRKQRLVERDQADIELKVAEFNQRIGKKGLSKIIADSIEQDSSDSSTYSKTFKKMQPLYDPLDLHKTALSEMKRYYEISRTQAESSFNLAKRMCVAGFVLLVVAVLIPLLPIDVGIEVAIIAAATGAVVELFAGTTMLVYKKSLEQLNYYYSAIHQIERYLSCVNLVSLLSPERQDSMLEQIIREEIKKPQSWAVDAPKGKSRRNQENLE